MKRPPPVLGVGIQRIKDKREYKVISLSFGLNLVIVNSNSNRVKRYMGWMGSTAWVSKFNKFLGSSEMCVSV